MVSVGRASRAGRRVNELNASHDHRRAWLVFSSFTLLPQPAGTAGADAGASQPPCLRVSV